MLAGAAAGIVNAIEPWSWGRWLALHLVFVGGVSQLILGASQFFAGAFLATDPPPRRLVRGQLAAWNLGVLLLAVAVPLSGDPLVAVAVALLAAGLALYAAGLEWMRRRSLRAAPWATRWYGAGAGFFAAGIVAGTMLALPVAWRHGDLLGAHMSLNLGGWFGAAIVGTLQTFFPSLTQTQLRFPRLQAPTFGAWLIGVEYLSLGYGWSTDSLAVAGWFLLACAATLLLVNVVGCTLARGGPLSLPARAVGAAQLFLVAGVIVAAITALSEGSPQALAGSSRAAIATLLVAGWIGLTVLGSLMHLLTVVVRVREFTQPMPAAKPLRDSAVVVVAATGVAGLAVAEGFGLDALQIAATAALLLACTLLGVRIVSLGTRVVMRARPRI
jgi:nitrite reductase (NO-forming)